MAKKILYRLLITLFPQTLILTGSLLLGFALKLVDTKNLWEQDGMVNGGMDVGGMGMNIPVQNDTLFWWGLILFLLGSALEFIRITHHVIKDVRVEEASISKKETPSALTKPRKITKKA